MRQRGFLSSDAHGAGQQASGDPGAGWCWESEGNPNLTLQLGSGLSRAHTEVGREGGHVRKDMFPMALVPQGHCFMERVRVTPGCAPSTSCSNPAQVLKPDSGRTAVKEAEGMMGKGKQQSDAERD